jgi:threonine dehydratase
MQAPRPPGSPKCWRHELPAIDLTDDEMVKSHVRYMVEGHAPQVDNEVLYRFPFPERPGALLNFLDNLRSDWNISLFHYRNHGADFGKVLVGMQVSPADRAAFEAFLERLGYEYIEETGNPAYRMFLG